MRHKKYLEKMAKKFPKLMTNMKPYVHKAWRIRSRKNIKGKKVFIIFKLPKTRDAKKTLKVTRERF